jgi:paraquat-inducible protein B
MSEKPQPVAIGAFIVGALLISIVTAIFILGSGFGQREKIVMVFNGSVKGLNIGAPVAIRGVQVGQVTAVKIILNKDTLDIMMLVEADFRPDVVQTVGSTQEDVSEELIKRGLRAQLNTQSLLTGLLYVEMDFHPNSEVQLADIDSPHFQFPTIPTDLERLAMKLQKMDFSKLAEDLESTISGINAFITSKDFQAMPGSLTATLDAVTTLSTQLQAQLATSIPKVDRVLDGAAVTVANANTQLPVIADGITRNLDTLNQAITAFETAMEDIDSLVAPDSPTTYRMNEALRELALAARAMQQLAKTLEEQPEALIRGRRGDN